MADHLFHLKRSGSTSSLASMAGDRKFASGGGGGALRVELRFQRPGPSDKKTAGTVHILVREARKLQAHDPYVKLYLSQDGKDQKGTKQKTKVVKKSTDPVYEDRFVYYLKKNTKIDDNNRVQITIWDAKTGLKHNECVGGLSFSLEELKDSTEVSGWYALMPEVDGRICNQFLADSEDIDPALIPGPSISMSNPPSSKKKEKEKKEKNRKSKALPTPVVPAAAAVVAAPAAVDTIDDLDDMANRFASRFGASPKVSRKEMPSPEVTDEASPTKEDYPSSTLSQEEASTNYDEDPVDDDEELPESPDKNHASPKMNTDTDAAPSPSEPTTSDSGLGVSQDKLAPPESVGDSPEPYGKKRRGSRTLPTPKADSTESTAEEASVPKEPEPELPPVETPRQQSAPQEHPDTPAPAAKTVTSSPTELPSEPAKVEEPPKKQREEGVLAKQVRTTLGNKKPDSSRTEKTYRTNSDNDNLPPSSSGMKRTNSLTSLVSVLSENVISGNAEGELQLYMYFEPMSTDSKIAGLLHVSVNEGRGLATKEPYVKMYLSKNNSNVKNSKQKTKTIKRTKNPVFQERFVFKILKTMPLDETMRLQIAIWDHARARANECTGGMSFTLEEIASTSRINGWFKVLPYREGRTSHQAAVLPASSSPKVPRSANFTPMEKPVAKEKASASGGGPLALPQHVQQDTASVGSGKTGSDGGSLGGIGLPPVAINNKTVETPVVHSNKKHQSRGIASVLLSGKVSKKEAERLANELQEAQEREELHIKEKGELHQKLNQLRNEIKESSSMESQVLKLKVQVSECQEELKQFDQIKRENEELKEEVEDLNVRIERLNDFVKLHTDDANRHTEEKVKLRDALSDNRDENQSEVVFGITTLLTFVIGLRNFISILQKELLQANPKAFQRAVGLYSQSLVALDS
eukprot:m.41102 g.41102  ORF g.41102 m.41102 type:complete len:920 (+) comp9737_c0_seq3:200-2959(+)